MPLWGLRKWVDEEPRIRRLSMCAAARIPPVPCLLRAVQDIKWGARRTWLLDRAHRARGDHPELSRWGRRARDNVSLMKTIVPGRTLLAWALLASGVGLFACSSSSSGPTGGTSVGDLKTECTAYCAKQASAGCSNPIANCESFCEGIGNQFPACEAAWNALNHCQANNMLICDQQGNPATTQCTPQVQAYGNCLSSDGGM